MKKVIKYISMLAITAFSSLLPVDIGNFRYISNKYRTYFPGKQLSVQSQDSSLDKTAWNVIKAHWPILTQATLIAAGSAVGYVAPKYDNVSRLTGIFLGGGIALFSSDPKRKQYRLDYKRYSKIHSEQVEKIRFLDLKKIQERVVQKRGQAAYEKELRDYKSTLEEYDVLSRYPKKKNVERFSTYNGIGAFALFAGSLFREWYSKIYIVHSTIFYGGSQSKREALEATANNYRAFINTDANYRHAER